ncbi:MAG TPA: putative porin [Steroidobacteraceae bacterium]|nr:putative porin [Steroidobacteraceae bacterium]
MHRTKLKIRAVGALILLGFAAVAGAAPNEEAKSLDELRNTLINLLQGLVERGVLTREQAQKMVQDAQARAQADATAAAAQEKEEESAVRVPYVPEVVKNEIRTAVASDLSQQVTRDVLDAARNQGWAVPGALPEWVRRMRWYGDIRLRGEGDLFASDNAPNSYLDFQKVNDSGGIGKAGLNALANVTEDRDRLRLRMRLGFEDNLGANWKMGARLATGALNDPISTNLTLGSYGQRGAIGLDQAWIDARFASQRGTSRFGFTGGRMANPFFTASELVYDQDLSFDGVATSYRYLFHKTDLTEHTLFATAGAFPLQEIELSSHDKWLVGGQLGLDLKYALGSRTRLAASWYRFIDTAGQLNAFQSNLLDYTAPQIIRRGNTVFDIRNDNDSSTNLYALAADYTLANASLVHDWAIGTRYRVTLAGDYVRNIGYSEQKILERTGAHVAERSTGYQSEISFGSSSMAVPHAWRAAFGYRHVERDAVLDAFTDSDFRLGGTDTKGYTLGFDFTFAPNVQARLRYLSGSEIDGPPFAVDVLQLDLTASF